MFYFQRESRAVVLDYDVLQVAVREEIVTLSCRLSIDLLTSQGTDQIDNCTS